MFYSLLFNLFRSGLCICILFLCIFIYIFFFFFQAEDGIRDTSVTGVQTCALPISRRATPADLFAGVCVERHSNVLPYRPQRGRAKRPDGRGDDGPGPARDVDRRSEERRVGKECRSRWWADDSKTRQERERQ